MKYYAVTDDPRELYHYGVKGMKWGQHIFGDKPKSPGYKRAARKLSGILKSQKVKLQTNARAREERKYERAIQKAQMRTKLSQAKFKYDQVSNDNAYDDKLFKLNQKAIARAEKSARKIAKSNIKQSIAESKYNANHALSNAKAEEKAAKAEKHFDKYLQEAREGRIRMGKLSNDQISRIQDRLNAEEQTRRLSGREKPSWRQQKKEARRAGYLSGITKGTAAAMEEVARAGATYGIQHLLDRKKLKSKAKLAGKEDHIKNREKNKKSHSDIKKELSQELYENQIRSGVGVIRRAKSGTTAAQKGKALSAVTQQTKLNNAYQDYLFENGLTDRQARKQYLEGLSSEDQAKYGKVRRTNTGRTITKQQQQLLSGMKKAKEEEIQDNNIREEIYKRYILPGKNDNPDKMLERFNNETAKNQIYGKVKTTTLSNNTKPPKSAPKKTTTGNPLFDDNLVILRNRKDVIRDAMIHPVYDAVEKSIQRYNKKQQKKNSRKSPNGGA